MEVGSVGSDIWVKHTSKDGASHTSYHRVWDVGLFMESLLKAAKKEGGKANAELAMKPPYRNAK